MSSLKESWLFASVKTAIFFFKFIPMGLGLWIGRCFGLIGYCFLAKKRAVVYANLKTAFADKRNPAQLRALCREIFLNFGQAFVELLTFPRMKHLGLERFVQVQGKEHVEQALQAGRGVIYLAIHSGSWELASVASGITARPYHIVVNDQTKTPKLAKLLNEYRRMSGAHIISAGSATKEIIKALKNNEIVSLVLDQGGKEGMLVPFLGKAASMSSGAVRLALKYGAAICPVWIQRQYQGQHILKVFPALSIVSTGDLEKDIYANMLKAVQFFEPLLRKHPGEYLWFYKVYKYSHQSQILIIDDGRTGHLRQSQALSLMLAHVLRKKEKVIQESIVTLQWYHPWSHWAFAVYAFLAQYFFFLRREDCLSLFLAPSCYANLMKFKADFIISCGFQAAGVNFILSQNHLAKSIAVLTPGLLSHDRFDGVALQEHDAPRKLHRALLIKFKIAPNLVNPAYLKEQVEGLTKYYSHLRGNVRKKFGVLIGGDTKGVIFQESQIRQLISQIKESALHYNADILLTTSRRTPPLIEQIILKELKNFNRCPLCIMANQHNVPQAVGGILGLSDLMIVSGESISMVSEALSSGKPAIVFSGGKSYGMSPKNKYENFVLQLNDQGYLMVSETKNLSANIAQLLSRKISLKTLDHHHEIERVLEKIC